MVNEGAVLALYKRPKMLPRIEFADQDLAEVHLPYEDALLVTLRVANYDIRRVLIDNGSAVNFIFLSTLRMIEFYLRWIEPTKTKLMGSSGEVKVLKGKITLLIMIGYSSNDVRHYH